MFNFKWFLLGLLFLCYNLIMIVGGAFMEANLDNVYDSKKKWTAVDELYMHLDRASCINSNFSDLISTIKNYNQVDIELKPIGIY